MCAAAWRSEEGGENGVMRWLVQRGADVNATDKKGWTALHWAVNANSSENVFAVMEHFPDITIRSLKGRNAFNVAQKLGYENIVETLRMNMPDEELEELDEAEMESRRRAKEDGNEEEKVEEGKETETETERAEKTEEKDEIEAETEKAADVETEVED